MKTKTAAKKSPTKKPSASKLKPPAPDAVVLGKGGTFKVRNQFAGWYREPGKKGWIGGGRVYLTGNLSGYIYAAPANSAVARLNGLGVPPKKKATVKKKVAAKKKVAKKEVPVSAKEEPQEKPFTLEGLEPGARLVTRAGKKATYVGKDGRGYYSHRALGDGLKNPYGYTPSGEYMIGQSSGFDIVGLAPGEEGKPTPAPASPPSDIVRTYAFHWRAEEGARNNCVNVVTVRTPQDLAAALSPPLRDGEPVEGLYLRKVKLVATSSLLPSNP
jgi:hypothetical protein